MSGYDPKEAMNDAVNGADFDNSSSDPVENEPVRTFTEIMGKVNRNRPELIEGIMFERTVTEIQGPSKSGKSTDECNMLVAFAGAWGGLYHGRKCKTCHALYISTENSLDDFGNMILDCIAKEPTKGMSDDELDEIIASSGVKLELLHVLDLSGKARPLDEIKDAIVRKANAIEGLEVILFDSIYPILTGDENSNSEMAAFVNLFNEIINHDTECALVFVQHTSKGYMNYSDPVSRSSGAGVFGRFPWTIIDMSELNVKQEARDARLNIEQCKCIDEYLKEIGYEGKFDTDVKKVAKDYRRACVDRLENENMNELIRRLDRVSERVNDATGVKISYRRRGARSLRPINCWFEYPNHKPDRDGLLGGSKSTDDAKADRRKEKAQEGYEIKIALIQDAVIECHEDGVPATRKNVEERIELFDGKQVTIGQIKEWTRDSAKWSPWRCMTTAPYELYRVDADETADTDNENDDSSEE